MQWDPGESDAEEDERGLTGTASLWFSAVNKNARGNTGNTRALLIVQGHSFFSLTNLKSWKDRTRQHVFDVLGTCFMPHFIGGRLPDQVSADMLSATPKRAIDPQTCRNTTFSDLQWPSVLIAICKLSSTRSTCSDLHRPRWTMHLCVCVRVLLNRLLNHVFAQYGERVATPGERKQSAWPEFDSWSVGGQLLHVWRSQGLEVKYQLPFHTKHYRERSNFDCRLLFGFY